MGSDQDKGLPLHHNVNAASGCAMPNEDTAIGRNNMIVMGTFAVLTFLVMFLVDPAKLKEMMINNDGGTAAKNHLSWSNLNVEKRAQRKANIGDDDSYTTVVKQVSRQSVLLDLMQEHKDTRPDSLQGKIAKKGGNNGSTSP